MRFAVAVAVLLATAAQAQDPAPLPNTPGLGAEDAPTAVDPTEARLIPMGGCGAMTGSDDFEHPEKLDKPVLLPPGYYLTPMGLEALDTKLAELQKAITAQAIVVGSLTAENARLKETTEDLAAQPGLDTRTALILTGIGFVVGAGAVGAYFLFRK